MNRRQEENNEEGAAFEEQSILKSLCSKAMATATFQHTTEKTRSSMNN